MGHLLMTKNALVSEVVGIQHVTKCRKMGVFSTKVGVDYK